MQSPQTNLTVDINFSRIGNISGSRNKPRSLKLCFAALDHDDLDFHVTILKFHNKKKDLLKYLPIFKVIIITAHQIKTQQQQYKDLKGS